MFDAPLKQKTLMLGDNQDLEMELADQSGSFYADPYGWVMWAFDWGHGELEGFDGPDEWQKDFLNAWGAEIRERGFDGVAPVDPIRFSTASGHGIGKSALVAMAILFILSTRPYSKGVITANTGDQLRTKTMAELAKWRRRCIVGHWFEMNAMSIYHTEFGDNWRADAQTCREENSEAFAGLHCANSTPFYIFDEASNVPEKIWEVSEGGLTDGEPMHFCFGNPTRNSGKFYETFNRQKHRWKTRQIDSRTAKMTNKRLIQQWIDDYGEDSDFVRVRVRGIFPRGGDMQFIPSDDVFKAMKRGPGRYLGDDPLICGIDMARGGDDNCYIVFRRGMDGKSEKVYRIPGEKSRDSMRVVSLLVMILDRHVPDVSFLDETGLGGPIGDRLRQLGYHVIGVNFGGKADDEARYSNKTSEMGWRCREWIMKGGSIPDDPQLEKELTMRDFWHDGKDRLVVEPKAAGKEHEGMKKRLGFSPDWADALYLTFAHAVPKREISRGQLDYDIYRRNMKIPHDPLDNIHSFDPEQNYDPLDAMDISE